MADFKKSVDALQFIKDLSMPQQAGKIVKASDAYAPFADQGIFTAPTMADRTIASPKGKLKGGMRFPYLQNVDPAYEGEVWGFGAGNMSTRLLNQFENVPSDKLLLSTILGNKYMHHSNPEVSAELIKQYRKGIKSGNLSDELRDVTNRRINQLTDEDGNPIFAPDSDVTDPAFYRSLDTFDKRAAMGNIMGGVGLNEGTERKRRVANQIFDYEGLMRKMTEPTIIGAPNSSIGSRIFTLSGTKSERPDLNKAYPHVVGGLDLNVDFGQVPFQHYLKDYTDNMMQTKGKVPGWFNLTRSSDLPTQEITDKWLQHLKNQGYADGGQVEHMQAGGIKKAIGALGELTTANRAPTVYEIAHQVAQRNAAKPVELGGLGLHADNTAMDRAKALGFEHQTYHGTDTPDIQAFDPSKTKMWNAIFSSTNPKEASDFSRLAISKERAKQMGHESSPNVMPLMLRNTDYATPEHLNPASIDSARKSGKAGLTHDSWAITLDPATIRSRFAAFDPAELSSPEILKAEGGKVEHMQAGGVKKAGKALFSELDNAIADVASAGRSPIVPMPNRWFLQPEKFPSMQGMVEKVLERTGRPRESFTSGAFVDPRTGEVLDSKILEDVGVVINPRTNRPAMSAGKEAGIDELEKELGLITKSNLVRNSLFKRSGGDPMLDDLAFLATIERSGMGHKYGLSTEYGSPTLLHNNQTGANPTLRPTSRGDVFGMGDVVGQVKLGKGIPHDVYEKLFVAPAGMDVDGVRLHKAEGGKVEHMQAGGMMGLVNEFKALKAAQDAARLTKATSKADDFLQPVKWFPEREPYVRASIPQAQGRLSQAEYDANLARFLEGSTLEHPLYHSTGAKILPTEPLGFSAFNPRGSQYRSEMGSHFGTTDQANAFGDYTGQRILPVHLSAKNPLRLIDQGGFSNQLVGDQLFDKGILTNRDRAKISDMVQRDASANDIQTLFQQHLKGHGIDSIKYLNRHEGLPSQSGINNAIYGHLSDEEFLKRFPMARDSHIVFDPTQVKSAIGNRGTFDPKDPDMTKAEGGAVHLQMGGMTPEPAGGSARQETFAAQHMEEGGDIMRRLFDHALDKGDIHEMTHAMLVKQHEAEYG